MEPAGIQGNRALNSQPAANWSLERSSRLYQIDRWADGFFNVTSDAGVGVSPRREESHQVDLREIVEQIRQLGARTPVLLRFPQVTLERCRAVQQAFDVAIQDCDYSQAYSTIYPIKVNQDATLVTSLAEDCRRTGQPIGLEAGSKAELLAVLQVANEQTPILCNGFKDQAYIELALRAKSLGYQVTIVVEKPSDIDCLIATSQRLNVRPAVGIRVKLATRGSGHWESTAGHRSKFGLTTTELLMGVERLRRADMMETVHLLHFHLGSQIQNIRFLKSAVTEATRIYCDLVKQGVPLETIDVGGGLAVDYTGGRSNRGSSMNYTLQEYANDVVYHVQSVCQHANVPEPRLYSESGRALVAHGSVLVCDVFGATNTVEAMDQSRWTHPSDTPPVVELRLGLDELDETSVLECFHDAQAALHNSMTLFNNGYLSLHDRSQAESLYRETCLAIRELIAGMDFVPPDLEALQLELADIYYGNFSLFRSLPDHWAIGQLFPVVPLQRLDEKPTQKVVLGDITCDSDGMIDRFIGPQPECRHLNLHPLDDSPYLLGIFLTGAYQEVLGGRHNLLGDPNVASVVVRDDGTLDITLEPGDSLDDVLTQAGYVSDSAENFDVDRAGLIQATLPGYCYLENDDATAPESGGRTRKGLVEANRDIDGAEREIIEGLSTSSQHRLDSDHRVEESSPARPRTLPSTAPFSEEP